MKNCINCKEKTRRNYCSKKECIVARAHNYYLKTIERRKAIGLENYYKYKKTSYSKLRETNTKAQNRKRFGVADVTSIKNKFDNKCGLCKKVKTLVIHHIDHQGRNVKTPNNDFDNLIPLCRGCHAKIHLLGEEIYLDNIKL